MSLNDQDLRSIQQARSLVARAHTAQKLLGAFSQEQVDRVVDAMAAAVADHAEPLARMAQEESTFGNVPDKITKNRFAAVTVAEYIRPIKTVGLLREDRENGIVEFAEPMGVVAAIVPCTNPTSTRSSRPSSRQGPGRRRDEPPPSATRWLSRPSDPWSTPERRPVSRRSLVVHGRHQPRGHPGADRSRLTGVILATRGIGLVRAAIRRAAGVRCRARNVPVYLDRSADVADAVAKVIAGKTFDYGTRCCPSRPSCATNRIGCGPRGAAPHDAYC